MRILGSLVVTAVLFVGCSSSPSESVGSASATAVGSSNSLIVVPDATGRFSPETRVECFGGPTFAAGALDNAQLLVDTQVADGAMDPINEFLQTGEGDFWPQDGYWVLDNTDSSLVLAHVGEQGAVTIVASERDGSGLWQTAQLALGGACRISVPLPDDLHQVDWRIDPTQEPTAESTTLALLATGQACSGGKPMGERLQPPQVETTQTTIYLLLVGTQPQGAQECPGNPEEQVTVELGDPLGDRQLVDARDAAGLLSDYVPVSP